MIFITVGTHYLGFERLIKKVDDIAVRIDEKIVAQIGSTRYIPKNIKYFTFVEEDEKILEFYKKSRIIITHAGAGSIINILYAKKPLIVVPRLKKYNEHIDDHQLELAEVLNNKGLAIVIHDVENLEKVLKNSNFNINHHHNNGSLVIFLKEYIRKIEYENLYDTIDSISS
jgi:UDP-N-acetylglucosamine transferase subunit ALG13